ncbi:MAG: tetraacyldisaccharide 4'-kinase [Proteobacteria bacterium]|nr:tetraacyldisaccharide 4'-kinase [Pseudomonadota bacterium]
MKTPKHWNRRGIRFEVMLSLTPIYYFFFLLKKRFTTAQSFPVPIICVGNITAGGAGKTPTAIAIARLLKKEYPKLAFVSRGYGGRHVAPYRVDRKKDSAMDVGDEPLLLADHAPCYIAEHRKDAIALAIKDGATLIIMDDGLQHFAVARDVNIVVIDGGFGFGNYGMLPAGPLREKIKGALARSHAILVIGKPRKELSEDLRLKALPNFSGTMTPKKPLPAKKRSYFAFAGIARPQKFYETLMQAGLTVNGTLDFADHHAYTTADIHTLTARATAIEASLVTTEKDWVRLPEHFRSKVQVVKAELTLDNEKALKSLLLKQIKKSK